MKKIKPIKKFISGTLATALLASFFGCTYYSKNPIELTYHNSSTETTTHLVNDNLEPNNPVFIGEEIEELLSSSGKTISFSDNNSIKVKRIEYCIEELINNDKLYGKLYQYENADVNLINLTYINIDDELYLKFNFAEKSENNNIDSLTIKIQKENKRLTSAFKKFEDNNNLNSLCDELFICLNYEIIYLHAEKEEYIIPGMEK